MKNSQSRLTGSNLRRVRRLSPGLLYLFVRLGGSLLDVERELHVVVVDANVIARLDRAAEQEPGELVLELSLDRPAQRPRTELGIEADLRQVLDRRVRKLDFDVLGA